MACSRTPIVLVLLILAACATTAPQTEVTTVETEDVLYLTGETTRFSVRLDEVRSQRAYHREDRLPNAVVAGDQTVTVVASLFRHDDVYTLDMVIQNPGSEPILLDRELMHLYDNRGLKLVPMLDWKEGHLYGLRAHQEHQRGYAHLGTDFESGQPGTRPDAARPKQSKKPTATARPSTRASDTANAAPPDFSWLSELQMEAETLMLPASLQLQPGDNAAYWAYWSAGDEKVELPITAAVIVDGKRMLFRFGEPASSEAR